MRVSDLLAGMNADLLTQTDRFSAPRRFGWTDGSRLASDSPLLQLARLAEALELAQSDTTESSPASPSSAQPSRSSTVGLTIARPGAANRSVSAAIWPEPITPPPRAACRVLHVINGEHYSGAERVQDLLGLALPDEGVDVEFACLKPGKFPALRRCQDAVVHSLAMRSRTDVSVVGRLRRLIAAQDYDIVHAHTPRSVLVARLALMGRKTPLVYHVHSPATRDSTRWISNWINGRLEQAVLSRCQAIICVSDSLKRDMVAHGWTASKLTVVPNGVPVARSLPRSAPFGVWTLGTVALFRPRKGLEVLLRSLRELLDAGRLVRLRAVGEFETPEYELAIQKLVRDLDLTRHVEFRGFRQDVTAELAAMDLFVLPSLFGEGMPMVVLEAMAVGLPVVASAVEGTAEMIRNGVEGRLVAAGNASALTEGITDFIDRRIRWEHASDAATERQRSCYSETSMAAAVAAVYDAIRQRRSDPASADRSSGSSLTKSRHGESVIPGENVDQGYAAATRDMA